MVYAITRLESPDAISGELIASGAYSEVDIVQLMLEDGNEFYRVYDSDRLETTDYKVYRSDSGRGWLPFPMVLPRARAHQEQKVG